MVPQALVAVERDADWSQWSMISRTLPDVVMLIQQPQEPTAVFHARLLQRAQAEGNHFTQLVLMRASAGTQPMMPECLASLAQLPALEVRVFPADGEALPVRAAVMAAAAARDPQLPARTGVA